MSDSSFDHARVLVPTSDFNPGHQLPSRSTALQERTEDAQPFMAGQNHDRAQQLDAGVLQTLNIQAKLAIGAPGDAYEQEADHVASQVVERINSPQAQPKAIQREAMPEDEEELQMQPLAQGIQRMDVPEEEELQMQPLAQGIQRMDVPEEEELQMKAIAQRSPDGGGQASTELESAIATQRGQGQPLDDQVRGSMEQAFGADFSGVRVHADNQSHGLNQSIQARAFTTGQDIFFRQGEYQPGNRGGQELLAHELTHVVQQNGTNVRSKQLS